MTNIYFSFEIFINEIRNYLDNFQLLSRKEQKDNLENFFNLILHNYHFFRNKANKKKFKILLVKRFCDFIQLNKCYSVLNILEKFIQKEPVFYLNELSKINLEKKIFEFFCKQVYTYKEECKNLLENKNFNQKLKEKYNYKYAYIIVKIFKEETPENIFTYLKKYHYSCKINRWINNKLYDTSQVKKTV